MFVVLVKTYYTQYFGNGSVKMTKFGNRSQHKASDGEVKSPKCCIPKLLHHSNCFQYEVYFLHSLHNI